jgi:galactokinase
MSVVRAPGRVNLIGEHTDYNDGFVLPMAIDREVRIEFEPRTDRRVIVGSDRFEEPCDFSLDRLERGEGWIEYVKGIAWALQESGRTLAGWEGSVSSRVPVGAGLSSSAALELAVARTFAAASSLPWEPVEMARLARKAEAEWVGVQCGIMDPLACAAARKGHALLIDCRTLRIDPVPLPAGTAVAVLDTGTRRRLADSGYNERRAQCEEAARTLGVKALRDAAAGLDRLGGILQRRARHVVSENERTLRAAEAMKAGDAEKLGGLMDASHASLRDDYEVSTPALDAIVEIARTQPGCFGARMTGAGFGGCAVALVRQDAAADLSEKVVEAYGRKMNLEAGTTICRAAAGVGVSD